MTDSLIECPMCKREAQCSYYQGWERTINCGGCGFNDTYGMLGSPPGVSSEISVENAEKEIYDKVIADLMSHCRLSQDIREIGTVQTVWIMGIQSAYDVLRPYLRTTEPVSVSLDKCPLCDLPRKGGECIYKTHNTEQPVECREAFEVWAGSKSFPINKIDGTGVYSHQSTQILWTGWKAGRIDYIGTVAAQEVVSTKRESGKQDD